VERIGVKTSRIRSLQGEELVVSNVDLTSARIKNFKKMEKRRTSFAIGVSYQTSHKNLKEIPATINKIILNQGKIVEFGRVHFKMFGESALIFEIVYFVLDSDYDLFMDIQQQINLEILEVFERKKIKIAYPTQTIHLEK
ncbi:MAG: mechanosensitive ion channel family protein, partial [Microgenomates group bacterium]